MPKRVFWPAAFITMGLIVIASLMGYLPTQFTMFWPLILIVVGLGGLLTSDRDDWMVMGGSRSGVKTTSAAKRSVKATKTKKTTNRR